MILNRYVQDYVAESESPKRYHQWCMVSAVATLLGRNYMLPFGFGNIYPNQFCMLIGSPGARKSTAIKAVVQLLKQSGYTKIAANKTTKEKLLLDLHGHEDDTGTAHTQEAILASNAGAKRTFQNLFGDDAITEGSDEAQEILVAADEFTNFTGAGNYEFISLLGELWDCPDEYVNRVKNSKSFTVTEPCVNIISGNTPTGFAAAFPPEVIGQGFISRLILVYGERTDIRITLPKPPSELLKLELVNELLQIREAARGYAGMEQEAMDAVDWLYKNWDDLDDMRFQNYSSRRLTHLLKLCMIFSAMHKRTTITIEDVIMANTLLTVTEEEMPKALGEFGKSKHSDVANKIVDVIEKHGLPMPAGKIWPYVQPDLEKMQQMVEILQSLCMAGKLQGTQQGYLPVKKAKKASGEFFNLDLIGGR